MYAFMCIFRYEKGKQNDDLNDGSPVITDTVVKSIELHDLTTMELK